MKNILFILQQNLVEFDLNNEIKNIISIRQQGGSVKTALSYLSPPAAVILIIFLFFIYIVQFVITENV